MNEEQRLVQKRLRVLGWFGINFLLKVENQPGEGRSRASSATAPASPKGAYSWGSTSCIRAVVRPRHTVRPVHKIQRVG